jgi:hypothetical protein
MTRWPSLDWPTICPHCGQHHDATTHMLGSGAVPDDGDISLCFSCGAFCVFDNEAYGGMRKPTKKEQRIILRDTKMQKLLIAWQTVKRPSK